MTIDPNAAPTAMQPDGLVERYASRSDELAEGGEYPWWSGLAELLRSQAAHITHLEADLREARMQALASDGQAQEAYEAQTRLEADVARLTKELDHWKANHAEMVQRNAVLRERPDLPADRLPSIERYEAQITSLATKVKAAQYAMDTVAKFVRPRIPADQNPEQCTSFLAWIGMILRREERAEKWEARFWKMDANFDRAVTRAETAEAQNKAMREALERIAWCEIAGTFDEKFAATRAIAHTTLSSIKDGA